MTLEEEAVPKFSRGHRLQHDRVRDVWLIQAPEKAFLADPVAATILQLVDGSRSVREIIDRLTSDYAASREVIATDVDKLLASLINQKVLTA